MPSPTSRTRPTSRDWSSGRYCSISDCRTETISSALNLMTASFGQLVPDGFQPCPHGGVVDPVADAHHEAAQQVRVHAGLQDGLAVEGLAELVPQALALLVGQRHRALHLDADASRPLV